MRQICIFHNTIVKDQDHDDWIVSSSFPIWLIVDTVHKNNQFINKNYLELNEML